MSPQLEQWDLFSEPTSNGSPAPASVTKETQWKVTAVHSDAQLKIVAPHDKGMILLSSLSRNFYKGLIPKMQKSSWQK